MKMIECSVCNHSNPASNKACENCGTIFETRNNVVETANGADPIETLKLKSEYRDKLQLEQGNAEPEQLSQTKHLGKPERSEDGELGTGNLRVKGDLLLKELETEEQFHLAHDALHEVLLGRSDQATGFNPTIDLNTVNGRERGVSRRHATIALRDDMLILIDHTSVNGTYLNGQRLVPEQPRVIRDNDLIRLGHLTLRVSYETE